MSTRSGGSESRESQIDATESCIESELLTARTTFVPPADIKELKPEGQKIRIGAEHISWSGGRAIVDTPLGVGALKAHLGNRLFVEVPKQGGGVWKSWVRSASCKFVAITGESSQNFFDAVNKPITGESSKNIFDAVNKPKRLAEELKYHEAQAPSKAEKSQKSTRRSTRSRTPIIPPLYTHNLSPFSTSEREVKTPVKAKSNPIWCGDVKDEHSPPSSPRFGCFGCAPQPKKTPGHPDMTIIDPPPSYEFLTPNFRRTASSHAALGVDRNSSRASTYPRSPEMVSVAPQSVNIGTASDVWSSSGAFHLRYGEYLIRDLSDLSLYHATPTGDVMPISSHLHCDGRFRDCKTAREFSLDGQGRAVDLDTRQIYLLNLQEPGRFPFSEMRFERPVQASPLAGPYMHHAMRDFANNAVARMPSGYRTRRSPLHPSSGLLTPRTVVSSVPDTRPLCGL